MTKTHAQTTFPLEWHRGRLENMRASFERERQMIERAVANLHRLENEIAYREAKIAEAERRGLTEYDHDRFMKRKG